MKVKIYPHVGLTELQTAIVDNLTEMIREFCNMGCTYTASLVPSGFRSFFLEGAMHPRFHIRCVYREDDERAPVHFFVDFREQSLEVFVVVYKREGDRHSVDWRRLYVLDQCDSLALFNVFETVISEVRNGN